MFDPSSDASGNEEKFGELNFPFYLFVCILSILFYFIFFSFSFRFLPSFDVSVETKTSLYWRMT